jgi:hypothetical protein
MTTGSLQAGSTRAGSTRAASTRAASTARPRLTWQLLLQATPAQVYDALDRAAVDDRRARARDEHDRWLVFSGAPGGPGERTTLCAYVREHGHGTLLQFGPADARALRGFDTRSETAAEVAEAASIGSLVHRMRSYLGAMPMPLG